MGGKDKHKNTEWVGRSIDIATYESIQQDAETPGKNPISRAAVRMRIEALVEAEVRPTEQARVLSIKVVEGPKREGAQQATHHS